MRTAKSIPVPLTNIGPVGPGTGDTGNLNVVQTYTVTVVRESHGRVRREDARDLATGKKVFTKPLDNIGNKSIPDYASYAEAHIHDMAIPGCDPGRVFVGQRKDGFVVNLGEIFDLVNTNPIGPRDAEPNTIADKNVTSLALEVPIRCLVSHRDPVLGGWTTASLRQVRVLDPTPGRKGPALDGGPYVQVSRLGSPLVNELVIGLPDKDRFNASEPRSDARFAAYVTNPSLAVLLNALFGDAARVPATPRDDLVAAFLTGIPALNQPRHVVPAEMLRLNTAIEPTPPAHQNDLGVLGADHAGFPNGRRPYDDVVDIELRVMEGAIKPLFGGTDPNAGAPYTDGARAAGPDATVASVTGAIHPADTYLDRFPYLATPIPGSPNGVAD